MRTEPFPVEQSAGHPTTLADRRERGLWLWSIVDVIFMFALALVWSLIAFGYYLYADGAFNLAPGTAPFLEAARKTVESTQQQPGRFITTFAITEIALLAPVVLRVRGLRQLPWRWLGVTLANFGRNVGIGVGLGVVALGLNIVVGQIFQRFGQTPDQSQQLFGMLHAGDYGFQTLLFLGVAVIAPIVEEVVFRGYIFSAWYARWGAPVAYVVSAAVFALPHLTEVTTGFLALLVPLFVLGILFAVAFHRTRSLVPSIVAHMINNGISTIVLLACTNAGSANCK